MNRSEILIGILRLSTVDANLGAVEMAVSEKARVSDSLKMSSLSSEEKASVQT